MKEETEEPSESFNEDSEGVSKKRKKGADGKEQPVKGKAKKVQKMPTIFKKGKWNPDVKLVDLDKYKEDDKSDLYLDCCIRCNNKNIIRAAITENERLLKMGIEQKKKISQLTAYWSPEI